MELLDEVMTNRPAAVEGEKVEGDGESKAALGPAMPDAARRDLVLASIALKYV